MITCAQPVQREMEIDKIRKGVLVNYGKVKAPAALCVLFVCGVRACVVVAVVVAVECVCLYECVPVCVCMTVRVCG